MIKLFLTSFILFIDISLARGSQTLVNQKNKPQTDSYHEFKEITKADISYIYDARGNGIISVNFDKNNNISSKTTYIKTNREQTFTFNDNCKLRECLQFIVD
tara:strand:+ start:55 stop:360 length:306 start_codon:yes stop_codon:yes gene_type:complete